MAYVDIGWPLGLAGMGAQLILKGAGSGRRWAVGGIMLTAAPMAAGVVLFPYRWPEDLPRHYAKLRYARGRQTVAAEDAAGPRGQCWANAFILAAPLACAADVLAPSAVEIVGWAGWLLS